MADDPMIIRRGRVNRAHGPHGLTTLQGDVAAGPGTGAVDAIITVNSITFAKLQDIAQSTLMGRGSLYGTGDPEEITLGPGLQMVDRTLQATPFAGTVFTFDEVLGAYTAPR
jgi:hypothetical protein